MLEPSQNHGKIHIRLAKFAESVYLIAYIG